MHVFVTGASGFVGSYVLERLLAEGHTARCLLRNPDVRLAVEGEGVTRVQGDVTQPDSFAGSMEGCDAVIHLVGIIAEKPAQGVTFEKVHARATRHVVAEARRAGIDRFIHMSANGARPDGVSGYQTSKWQGEEHVREGGFVHWTILRPSLVFGDPRQADEEFCTRLASDLIRPFPILPVFGSGDYRLQPVPVETVAAAFVQALTHPVTRGKTYCVAGRETFSYREILDCIAQGMGLSPKPTVSVPLWLARPAIHTLGQTGLLPISPDQFEMLLEGNTCDARAFYQDFGLSSKVFNPENLAYLRRQ